MKFVIKENLIFFSKTMTLKNMTILLSFLIITLIYIKWKVQRMEK